MKNLIKRITEQKYVTYVRFGNVRTKSIRQQSLLRLSIVNQCGCERKQSSIFCCTVARCSRYYDSCIPKILRIFDHFVRSKCLAVPLYLGGCVVCHCSVVDLRKLLQGRLTPPICLESIACDVTKTVG